MAHVNASALLCLSGYLKNNTDKISCVLYTRSWKNHLRSVAKENQLSIYQTLCILVHEVDRTLFTTRMDQFTNYWSEKEPQFIKYFNTYYKERAGKHLVAYIRVVQNIHDQKNGQDAIGTFLMLTLILTCIWKGTYIRT